MDQDGALRPGDPNSGEQWFMRRESSGTVTRRRAPSRPTIHPLFFCQLLQVVMLSDTCVSFWASKIGWSQAT